MKSKILRRAEWILQNHEKIINLRKSTRCPDKCKAHCHNGRTCPASSGPGWGFWVQAFGKAGIECSPMNYWSGKNPTPSTSIDKNIADFIIDNAPADLI